MADQPTAFIETNALLAAMGKDDVTAKALLRSMLPGERRQLRRALEDLDSMIEDVNAEQDPAPAPDLAHCVDHDVQHPDCVDCAAVISQRCRARHPSSSRR